MASPEQLAKSIVRESLRPKEYESVVISTYPHTTDLAEQIALQCQKVGADPLILLETDKMFYDQFKNYSVENLKKVSAHCIGLAQYANSYVWLGGPKDPSPMARVPRELWAAMYEGEEAHHEIGLQKKAKNVGVAIGQVTRERAKTYGFNYVKWKQMVESAIAADYKQMAALGKTVAGLLSTPVGVHVWADNGTDLKFRLAGMERRVDIDDGVISDEDFTAENRETSLPAGGVFVAPIEDSADGTFVCDVGIPQAGKLIEGLAWTFRQGRVVDFAAKKNLDKAQIAWDTATGAKDMLGWIGLGLNKKVKAGFLNNAIAAGTVSVGIGDNRSLGGKNASSYGFMGNHSTATVEVAGKTVIERGKWVI